MDPDVVRAKLESLARCIRRIEGRMPASADSLRQDLDAQDIIMLNLERAVQLCVDAGGHVLQDYDVPTPDSMAATFFALADAKIIPQELAGRLAKAAGFRNIAVYDYRTIDLNIVYAIVTAGLDDFRRYAEALMRVL